MEALTPRMRDVLAQIIDHDARGLRYRSSTTTTGTCKALSRRGLVTKDAALSSGHHGSHYWSATSAGLLALAEARP